MIGPKLKIINTTKRIHAVDALRGFALAGVALVHMTEQYIGGPTPEGFMEGVDSLPDQIIKGLIGFLFIGKFFGLFSILFGLSFSIQMDSAYQKGNDFSLRFLWRAFLLLLIGIVHHMFYRGDILTIYAVLAPLLIPFHRLSNKWILGMAAICFLSIPRFISYALVGNSGILGLPGVLNSPLEPGYVALLRSGPLTTLFWENLDYGMRLKISFQITFFGRFYYTFGYFLLGLYIGRSGILRQLSENRKKVRKWLIWSAWGFLGAAVLGAATFFTAPQPVDFSNWHQVLGLNFFDWANLAMTSVIFNGFLLLYLKQNWEQKLQFFAPYGRMALTNYLLQALIGTALFFGWGFGLLEQIRTLYLFFLAIAVFILQRYLSKWWLSRFKYGPLEWLWRSGTFLRWQQMPHQPTNSRND